MLFKSIKSVALIALGVVAIAEAHFVLQEPVSLGFDDDAEGTAPCGGFNASSRLNVTNWPTSGGAVGVLTTHTTVQWEYKVARLSNLTNWVSVTPTLNQTGVGNFCETLIPGKKAWEGESGVLQVIQHGVDGALYQCAAIKFVKPLRTAALVPTGCTNSTGVTAQWI
ncbi:hypothetical protein G7Y89_g11035 [Cudoniella acicularis]|uniref:Copper acquisition factor BIM1-like domain-containing protein n=1 Tax=Cudoniella acicularis TaxID=354080 RepID=A0A8H4W109_9HELO|nr:hypothetical protein G7Y89_g11035 [Cudoniella acicularis]